jgi:hypothetical protein
MAKPHFTATSSSYTQPEINTTDANMRATDRVLALSVIEGKQAQTAAGRTDNRQFTGKQTLHVKMDPHSSLWSFRYGDEGQRGLLPGGLEGVFTSFSKAYAHAESYFQKRNVKITEVKD